jgi:hypothetical protein
MKDRNLREVYITRNSDSDIACIHNPNIGIAKYKGCVFFASARSVCRGSINYSKTEIGLIDDECVCSICDGQRSRFRSQFGFIPKEGTAWIVNTTTLKRKRIDREMALLDPDTCQIIG